MSRATEAKSGKLADNIAYFARALRDAGLRLGPSAVVDAVRAVEAAGIGGRDDLYWTLHCVLVKRREDSVVFHEAFQLFWRSRDLVEKMMALSASMADQGANGQMSKAGAGRVAQALFQGAEQEEQAPRPDIEVDAAFSMSDKEVLRSKDFAQMSVAELAQARHALAKLAMPKDKIRTRRTMPDPRGAIFDARAVMRKSMATGGDFVLPQFRSRRIVQPPLVVLTDISGSMSQYSRIFLHYLHALTERRKRVHTFLFGTRLTNITRALRTKDPDEALHDVAALVPDWEGGTRIGGTLRQFNRLWARRVLGQRATVLLITDGLERDGGAEALAELARETERLSKSCRRLIWLNPLLRFDGFEPRAAGVRAMLPYVDDFRAVHSIAAFADLTAVLNAPPSRSGRRKSWQLKTH